MADPNNKEYDSNETLKQISKQSSLLDILVEFEATLDGFHLYAFKNWENGVVVAGPMVSRYFVDVTLEYDKDKMPEPIGGKRLTEHGIKVFYEESEREEFVKPKGPGDYEDEPHKTQKKKKIPTWLVHIKMPKRFIEEGENTVVDVDAEDEYIDKQAAQDADNEGLDPQTAAEPDISAANPDQKPQINAM